MADPLVYTLKGLIPRSQLTVRDTVTEHETARRIVTEYYLGDELVKSSTWDDAWRPLELTGNV